MNMMLVLNNNLHGDNRAGSFDISRDTKSFDEFESGRCIKASGRTAGYKFRHINRLKT